jgi:hypothetical protein
MARKKGISTISASEVQRLLQCSIFPVAADRFRQRDARGGQRVLATIGGDRDD